MPTTPKITTIVNALDTLLDTIAAGATYNTTPKITQYRATPFVSADLPAINLRVLSEPRPADRFSGVWDHAKTIALDIAATSAAGFHNTLVDVLIAIDSDLTLSGNVIDINYLGYELVYEQEDKSFVGGTVTLEFIYRTDDMRI